MNETKEILEIKKAWEKAGEKSSISGRTNARQLCEYDGVVLAVIVTPEHCQAVTWSSDFVQEEMYAGHYFDSLTEARANFVSRSGLMEG